MTPATIGPYEVIRPLGVGGMGEVFLCRSIGAEGFSAEVVVKRVRADRAVRQRYREMFADEARLAARLGHPNLVKVFDFGEDDAGLYLAMDHVHGRDLADALDAGPPPPVGMAAHIARSMAHALAYAHDLRDDAGEPLGLVHRDVSPQNVLLGYAGEIKLSDFGVARSRAALRESTGDGIKGKLRYLSPEQARSEPLDGRADVYAVGLVLCELLTGAPALDGLDEAALLNAASRAAVRPPEQAPSALATLLSRCLSPSPADRPNARELAEQLDAFILAHVDDPSDLRVGPWLQARLPAEPRSQPSVAAVVDSRVSTLGRSRPGPRRVLIAGALVAAAAGVGLWLLSSDSPAPTAAKAATAPADAAPPPPTAETEEAPARPKPAKGWLEIQVRPHGRVWVDGKLAGDAPVRVRTTAGVHKVKASNRASGRSKTVRVRVKPGGRTKKTIEL